MRSTKRLVVGVFALVGLLVAFTAYRGLRAAQAGLAGRDALSRAETDILARRIEPASLALIRARAEFATMRTRLRSLGHLGAVARATPLVGTQIRGAEAFADAGTTLSRAGLQLARTAADIIAPSDEQVPIADALGSLKSAESTLQAAAISLDAAIARVRSVEGATLLWPLAGARGDFSRRLPRVKQQVGSMERGLSAIIAFAGASGPRRYLVLSQNPDEVRPTGGFIGTYGVLTADQGGIRLERYDSIESWYSTRRQAVIPAEQAGIPFTLLAPPRAQTLANVNAVPDWPAVSRLAADLWQRGGEREVDGVLSLTPAFLGDVLEVVGGVSLPEYENETVTSSNVVERLEYHTHVAPTAGDRKEYVGVLAEAVVRALLRAPRPQWEPLARAVGGALGARELLVWSRDPAVQAELADRGWDGALPETAGDFFYDGELEFAAKNGRALRRTFDHHVEVRRDGSARITTTITIENTKAADENNTHSISYIRIYGPRGAELDPASDAAASREAPLAGHPVAGWFRSAPPLGSTTLKVVWDAPDIVRRMPDGSLVYALWWMRLPDHAGDVLNLRVDLPAGWRWTGSPPPRRIELDADVVRTWGMRKEAPR